ncbi:MAG: TonB-dependent receptor [Candidatus Elarobacter sp.]
MATLLITTFVLQATTSVLAGTTGGVSGFVLDENRQPVVAAKVTIASPSQTASTVSDASGHFAFLSLLPDTYAVTVGRAGYTTENLGGITVQADNTVNVDVHEAHQLKQIGSVTSRSFQELVRAGVTSDIYSVSAAQATAAQGLGGGGSLNQAYSPIAAVPGVYIPLGQNGWNQQVYVRGSNYDQTGYEYDGVPVNRAFDNYAAHTAASIGQQELQVYTGGGPASASASGLGGFINQTVRTGTNPGYKNFTLGLGAPTFYHQGRVEFGAATPNRNFSYYLGFDGYNQDFRQIDQFNGASLNSGIRSPLTTATNNGVAPYCTGGASGFTDPVSGIVSTPAGAILTADPGCYAFAGGSIEQPAQVTDREFVANFHFGIPHRDGAGRDDLQLLYTNSALNTYYADSVNDIGANTFINAYGATPAYRDSFTYAPGTRFGAPVCNAAANGTPQAGCGGGNAIAPVNYFFPDTPTGRLPGASIAPGHRDGFLNDASIMKLQYTKNFSANAYARAFVYAFYSDWLNNGAVTAGYGSAVPVNVSPDYELITHTRGAELQFADQLNAKNLLQLTANFTTATAERWNNGTRKNTAGAASTNLADAAGNCYDSSGTLAACNNGASRGTFSNPAPFATTGAAAAAGANWIVTLPGQQGPDNTVKPNFYSVALTDQFNPTDRLALNIGLRRELFEFNLAQQNDPGAVFWANAASREACFNSASLAFTGFTLSCGAGSIHPDGQNGHPFYTVNYPAAYSVGVTEPRVSGTYRIDPDTVLRASYGRYAEPPNAAAVQYNEREPNTPGYFFPKFSAVGFFEPLHNVRPAIADNYDFSIEKHLHGTDVSLKLTPFLRNTKDNLENVFIDQATQYVSSINAGTVKTDGIEFAISKGDFNRNGVAASLGLTYTNGWERYTDLGNTSVNTIDQINAGISGYNALAAGPACYTNGGTPSPACANSTDIRNPYFGKGVQPLLNRDDWYAPFNTTPAVPGAVASSYFSPLTVTGIVNFKHNRLTVTPSLQYVAGAKYGAPLNSIGYDPSACSSNQSIGIVNQLGPGHGDPLKADWTSCGGTTVNPEP